MAGFHTLDPQADHSASFAGAQCGKALPFRGEFSLFLRLSPRKGFDSRKS